MKLHSSFRNLLISSILASSTLSMAQPACFHVDGKLVTFDGVAERVVAAAKKSGEPVRVHRVWGNFQGKPLATLDSAAVAKAGESDMHGPERGYPLAQLDPSGNIDAVIAENVVRAFPSPDAESLTYITADRRCVVYQNGKPTTLTLEGRASHVAWSPDRTKLAVVVYPDDWSPDAVNNARTTADFFRLQTSKILLFDATSLAPLGTVVENDGTNYNPFFSPDAAQLFYIHLDLLDNRGGVRRLSVVDVGTTVGELILPVGEPPRGAPLGRVGTYLWQDGRLIFEAGTPEGGGILWQASPATGEARRVADGRFPQRLPNGRIAYLKPDNHPAILDLPAKEDIQR